LYFFVSKRKIKTNFCSINSHAYSRAIRKQSGSGLELLPDGQINAIKINDEDYEIII